MSNQLSREYKLTKIEVELSGGTSEITGLVTDFIYHESIESPFIRMDFTIADGIDFNKSLYGGETINVELDTTSSKGNPLKCNVKIFKIGSTIKSERGQLYILHCVSPEMFDNEMHKVFDAYGPTTKNDVENIPYEICKKYLKPRRDKFKKENFEDHSKLTFISPSWKPSDAIAYMSDKVTRKKGSGAGKQSGFLFFENRDGFQFRSIDALTGGEAQKGPVYVYTYVSQGSDPPENGMYAIESVNYPDKVDHLTSMRLGTYKSLSIGISLFTQTESRATSTGSSGGAKPSGTVYGPRESSFGKIFKKATLIESQPPYTVPKDIETLSPRQKFRILPIGKNQQEPNDGGKPGAATIDNDVMDVSEYAAGRYQLLKAIQITVSVPGNTGLTVGTIVQVIIPASLEESKRVKEDTKFSGKYLIAGLSHTYKREGVTTLLVLQRDSIKKSNY